MPASSMKQMSIFNILFIFYGWHESASHGLLAHCSNEHTVRLTPGAWSFTQVSRVCRSPGALQGICWQRAGTGSRAGCGTRPCDVRSSPPASSPAVVAGHTEACEARAAAAGIHGMVQRPPGSLGKLGQGMAGSGRGLGKDRSSQSRAVTAISNVPGYFPGMSLLYWRY